MLNGRISKSKSLQARILTSSFVLLSGSGLATGINFAYNIAVARFLGPKGFGDATAVYTLLTFISAVVFSFQIVSAKVAAQQNTPEGKTAAYRPMHRGAWACGLLAALALLIFARGISHWLNLGSALPVVLIAIGAAFYVPLGSRRGYLQGTYGFRRLAGNLVLEGAVRFGGSLLLILFGFGVAGVIAANSAAVAVAYLVIVPAAAPHIPFKLFHSLRELSQAMVFFSGQVLINNCDIVLVKHFFLPTAAGLYTAVAMVGRVIFVLSSAVVNSMFPLVAGTDEQERRGLKVIATSLLLVLGIGSLIALGLRLAPASLWTACFGSGFVLAGKYGLPYLLSLYAITTVIYSLSAVIITYEMAYKVANTSWVQLAFSGAVIAGIWRFHSSLREVILVQLLLMAVLLIVVAVPFFANALRSSDAAQERIFPPLRTIRPVTEDEVIAEFLRTDFNNPAFGDYREALSEIVLKPNLQDAGENVKRRALFFLRHLALWSELPTGTDWYEIDLQEEDLAQIRVFPRAHWRKIARGNFSITEIANYVSGQESRDDDPFLAKINDIRDQLAQTDSSPGPIVLIGVNGQGPLTILDGNHRLLAAMLTSPSSVPRLRFFCGLSPKMAECCWYNTNLLTLFHYGRNVLSHVARRPKAQLGRFLQSAG